MNIVISSCKTVIDNTHCTRCMYDAGAFLGPHYSEDHVGSRRCIYWRFLVLKFPAKESRNEEGSPQSPCSSGTYQAWQSYQCNCMIAAGCHHHGEEKAALQVYGRRPGIGRQNTTKRIRGPGRNTNKCMVRTMVNAFSDLAMWSSSVPRCEVHLAGLAPGS
jgi:hypothetical protein